MSLDIGIKAKREVYIYDSNVTYNLADIYYKCIDGGFKTLNEMSCKDALPILNKAIEDMILNEKEYRKLEPSNGWGIYDGLLQEFKDLKECCEKNLDGIISID